MLNIYNAVISAIFHCTLKQFNTRHFNKNLSISPPALTYLCRKMKKVAALILSIVYFAATVAGMGHVSNKASYAHVTAGIKQQLQQPVQETSASNSEEDFSINCQLKKTAKHLSGKVKAPRPAGFSSIIIREENAPSVAAIQYGLPENFMHASPRPLYLRHCVFIL